MAPAPNNTKHNGQPAPTGSGSTTTASQPATTAQPTTSAQPQPGAAGGGIFDSGTPSSSSAPGGSLPGVSAQTAAAAALAINSAAASAAVGGAVSGFWRTAWTMLWPALEHFILEVWAAIKASWSGIVNTNMPAGVNSDAGTNAAVQPGALPPTTGAGQ